MKCLVEDCNNEFENKTGRRRFCSDACKMKWHRKHPQKNVATKFDIQVLLNEFKATIQEAGKQQQSAKQITPMIIDHPKPSPNELTFQQHMNKIGTLIFPDDRQEYISVIELAANLSDKQKTLLMLNLKQSKL